MGDKLFRQINGSLFYIGETSEQIMPRGEEESYRNAFSGNLNTVNLKIFPIWLDIRVKIKP